MFVQKGLISHLGRTAMVAGVAAIALTAVEPAPAVAAQAGKAPTTIAGSSGATDFSSQRRYYRRGGGGAAAAAAFAGIVGTGIAIAAANSRPYYYDSYGYYGGPPVAYYGGPGYGYYGGYGYYPNGGRYVGGYNTGQYW